jgi:hypothetical protein
MKSEERRLVEFCKIRKGRVRALAFYRLLEIKQKIGRKELKNLLHEETLRKLAKLLEGMGIARVERGKRDEILAIYHSSYTPLHEKIEMTIHLLRSKLRFPMMSSFEYNLEKIAYSIGIDVKNKEEYAKLRKACFEIFPKFTSSPPLVIHLREIYQLPYRIWKWLRDKTLIIIKP